MIIKMDLTEDSLEVDADGEITERFSRIVISDPERVRIDAWDDPNGKRLVISLEGRPLIEINNCGELVVSHNGVTE